MLANVLCVARLVTGVRRPPGSVTQERDGASWARKHETSLPPYLSQQTHWLWGNRAPRLRMTEVSLATLVMQRRGLRGDQLMMPCSRLVEDVPHEIGLGKKSSA